MVQPSHLSEAEADALALVHPDLVTVVNLARIKCAYEFTVTCGARSAAIQRGWVNLGLTKTKRSRHVPQENESGLAEAVDVMPRIDGVSQPRLLDVVAIAFFNAARELGFPITWGCKSDPQHFELTRRRARLPKNLVSGQREAGK
jgi:peptidoglycan L-alanyl-D-glutamate endopeptidase CwlK